MSSQVSATAKTPWSKVLNVTVLIAALGYFVDMFDLTIFGIVRVESLKAIGYTSPEDITHYGMILLNLQAFGMLVGGLLWGVLGDKKGRLSVLFGSIILYSVANFLNAFVTDIYQYGTLRLLAGIGLAGELGAAVTLVSEILDKEVRGIGTTLIATVGLMGSVAAALTGQYFSWTTAYMVGGVLGFLLLLARFKMADSKMFNHTQKENRGDLRLLLSGERLTRYLKSIAVGIPIYLITGIFLTFSPELAQSVGLAGVTAGKALLYGTIGLTLGDLLSGLTSQKMKSRKKSVAIFMSLGFLTTLLYFYSARFGTQAFYVVCFSMGLMAGYWAVLVTLVAEQFGTNIRATAATSVPNFVRSAVIPLTLIFGYLKSQMPVPTAAIILSVGVFALAFWSLWTLKETYGRDLDFEDRRQEKTLGHLNFVETPVASAEATIPQPILGKSQDHERQQH